MTNKLKSISPLFMVILGYLLTVNDVVAEISKSAFVPLTFYSETREIKTSACLQVIEHSNIKSWVEFKNTNNLIEKRLIFVLKAIKNSNSKTLYELSHVKDGRDADKYKRQEIALFTQFKNIEVVSVPYYYEMSDLVIFYVKLKYKNNDFFSPFIYKYDSDGLLRFLPYRSDDLFYNLLNDWFDAPWGPAKSRKPQYCSDNQIVKASYKVSFEVSTSNNPVLYLTGSSVKSGIKGSLVNKKYNNMKTALKNKEIESFVSHLTLEGGSRLKDWFLSASKDEQEKYVEWFSEQEPFFIFDASPIIIVYTKTTSGLVQVFYYLSKKKNELIWINSSHVTDVDKLFKRDSFLGSASMGKPFNNYRVN